MHYVSFCLASALFFVFNAEWFLLDSASAFYNESSFLFWFSGSCSFGIDGISSPFIYLTLLLVPLCILYNWHYSTHVRSEYSFLLFCSGISLVLFFMASNILLFFFLFECLLFPFFLMFGLRASRTRKFHASFLLFFYTLFGSLALLTGIIYLYSRTGTLDLFLLTCVLEHLDTEYFLCGLFLMSFFAKIPIIPLHNWLPEAHVEAPTELSVLLAGVILKIGAYGFLRILLPIFPYSFYYLSPLLLVVVVFSVLYASLTAICQSDIKKIIAYSSIAHMNISIIGLCAGSIVSMCGSIFLMFSHGIVSAGLFFLIGMLYERYGTKIVKYYTGLSYTMPIFSTIFFLFILGNIGFPLTCGFVGEMLILLGLPTSANILFICTIALSIFISSIYNVWMYNKMFFGVPSVSFVNDITYRELAIIFPITLHLIIYGLFPNIVIEHIYSTVLSYYVF